MRVEHYAIFRIFSEDLTPDEISNQLGTPADSVRYKGARRAGPPPIPRSHIWEITSHLPRKAPSRSRDDPWIPLSAQVEEIVDRLEPFTSELSRLCSDPQVVCRLTLVRYYYHDLSDQANLGFDLDLRTLTFLVKVGAIVDVDEYDFATNDDDDDAE